MKVMSYALIIMSLITLFLSLAVRFNAQTGIPFIISGIGGRGYLLATSIMLLYSANLLLLQLINKK